MRCAKSESRVGRTGHQPAGHHLTPDAAHHARCVILAIDRRAGPTVPTLRVPSERASIVPEAARPGLSGVVRRVRMLACAISFEGRLSRGPVCIGMQQQNRRLPVCVGICLRPFGGTLARPVRATHIVRRLGYRAVGDGFRTVPAQAEAARADSAVAPGVSSSGTQSSRFIERVQG